MPAYKDTGSKSGKTKWYVQFYYADWNGQRRKKLKRGFETRKIALEWERSFLEQQEAAPDMNFGALVEIYLEDCKTRLKPTTFNQKEYAVRKKILPFFKDLPINAITAAQVRSWQNHLMTMTYKPGHSEKDKKTKPRKYADTYLKTVNAQLSAIFNFAMRYYGLKSNPARLAGSIGKMNAEKVDFWTMDEFNQFLEAVSDKPLSRAVFSVLFWTGIRSGELLALTHKDIDYDARTMRIDKSYARLNGHDLIQRPKTKKSVRVVTLPEPLIAVIKDYIKTLYKPEPNERLFEVTKYYLSHEMIRGCKLSGVRKIRVHDLRHSHASLLIEMGYSPLLIKERLGHEKIQTTLSTYSHLYPNKQAALAGDLAEVMSKKKIESK